MRELTSALKPVSARWYMLGIQLEVPPDQLDVIRADNPYDTEMCMVAMLKKWQQKYPNQGWENIVAALSSIDKNGVAEDVAKQYCNSSLGI